MKRQTVYVLGGIFVLLIGLVALSRYVISQPSLPSPPPFDLAAVTAQTADQIVLGTPQSATTLARVKGVWRVGEGGEAATASAKQVAALFDAFKRARFERLVTKDLADPSSLGFTPAAARRVVVMSGETTKVAFLVGDPADVPGSDYVQAVGDKAVWVVSGDLRSATDPNPALWKQGAPAPPGAASPTPGTAAPPTGAPVPPAP